MQSQPGGFWILPLMSALYLRVHFIRTNVQLQMKKMTTLPIAGPAIITCFWFTTSNSSLKSGLGFNRASSLCDSKKQTKSGGGVEKLPTPQGCPIGWHLDELGGRSLGFLLTLYSSDPHQWEQTEWIPFIYPSVASLEMTKAIRFYSLFWSGDFLGACINLGDLEWIELEIIQALAFKTFDWNVMMYRHPLLHAFVICGSLIFYEVRDFCTCRNYPGLVSHQWLSKALM